jgi:hypothetical protein
MRPLAVSHSHRQQPSVATASSTCGFDAWHSPWRSPSARNATSHVGGAGDVAPRTLLSYARTAMTHNTAFTTTADTVVALGGQHMRAPNKRGLVRVDWPRAAWSDQQWEVHPHTEPKFVLNGTHAGCVERLVAAAAFPNVCEFDGRECPRCSSASPWPLASLLLLAETESPAPRTRYACLSIMRSTPGIAMRADTLTHRALARVCPRAVPSARAPKPDAKGEPLCAACGLPRPCQLVAVPDCPLRGA